MDLYAVLNEVEGLLQRRGRASYRLLRAHFGLSTEQLDALRAELFYTHPGEVGEDTHGLVWHAGPVAAQESPVSTSIVHALPNAASSPCCFVTWWTRRRSPASSTRKTCARWCGPIKRPAPR